jgi:hypothetical protein
MVNCGELIGTIEYLRYGRGVVQTGIVITVCI